MNHIVGLLLAGGASTRYGGNKLIEQFDGMPVGLRAARTFAAAVDELRVVVPPDRPATVALFEPEFTVTICADAREGIGRSIAHGVASTADADGWLIALADMPFLDRATILAVKGALTGPAVIVRPSYHGRAGHPVGFGSAYAPALLALRGDSGAAPVIRAHPDALVTLDLEDPGIVLDIDRPEDLVKARGRF